MATNPFYLSALLVLFGVSLLSAQKNLMPEKRFTITISGGTLFSNGPQDMYSAMLDAMLDDDYRNGPSHYTYPYSEKKFGTLDIAISFKLNKYSGILIGGSLLERFETVGRSAAFEDVKLVLETNVKQLHSQYQYFVPESRFTFSIGPSLTFIHIEDDYPSGFHYRQKYSGVNPSVTGGVAFDFLDTDKLFLSISVNGNYVLPSDIGPFIPHKVHALPSVPYLIKYEPSNVQFSSMALMLVIGLKS